MKLRSDQELRKVRKYRKDNEKLKPNVLRTSKKINLNRC